MPLYVWFLLFVIYSFIGYLVEVFCVSTIEKKFVPDRGFLIGPWLPIYGMGSVIITYFFTKYQNDPVTLIVLSMFSCTTLEYITSYILEKVFKLRWWDYSDKRFNIEGRVCLENGILFGLGGFLIIEILNPAILPLVNILSPKFLRILSTILFGLFMLDEGLTIYVMTRLKLNLHKLEKKDSTEQIRREVTKFIRDNRYFVERIFNSFPGVVDLSSKSYKLLDSYRKKLDVERAKLELERAKRNLKNAKKNK